MQIVTGSVAAGTRAVVQRLHTYKGCIHFKGYIYLMLGKKQIPHSASLRTGSSGMTTKKTAKAK
jgi:hypothetical protein